MIDNYDSFTYNLVQYLWELGTQVTVYRNDQIAVDQIISLNPRGILISPGPCTPDKAGISLDVIRKCRGKLPILGVCLGHQSIGQLFGGKVVQAKRLMHGKISKIYHTGKGIFTAIPSPFDATRYHSLAVCKDTLPACLEVTAWTEDDKGNLEDIMGLKHTEFAIEGVQFHPESILTESGKDLLRNFLTLCYKT